MPVWLLLRSHAKGRAFTWMCALSAWLGQILVCHVSIAHAQRAPDPSNELQLIESTERSEDPLGIDESTGKELDRAAARLPKPKPNVILPSASQGAALSAIPGVRERAHDVQVRLAHGLAFVKVRLSFTSTAKHAAEIGYRLALPKTAVVTRVQVCALGTCSDALLTPHGERARPIATSPSATSAARTENGQGSGPAISAEPIDDARGRALSLRIAPILPAATLEAQLEYVAEAGWLDGRARFRVEARGYDPNLAATDVHVEAAQLRAITPSAQLSADPWTAIDLSASLPSSTPSVRASQSAQCGSQTCSRTFEASARADPVVRATWLLIDASPSMEGPARGRLSLALAALLGVLPEATDVRALAFAARAVELGRFRAGAAPLTQLSDATMLDLDAATEPKAALALLHAEIARERPRIVVLSDGLFNATKEQRDALDEARRLGAETFLVALGDTAPRLAGSFSHTLHVAELAEAAGHGDQLEPLEDALRIVTERTLSNGLKAGEQRVREQRPRQTYPLHAGHWLPLWLARDRPAPVWQSAASGATVPFIAAVPYRAQAVPEAPSDTGLPKESVLSMLRTQLVPQARACLRSDRKGRANYAVGLAFRAIFAQREVYEAQVDGTIPRPLRSCLEAILPKLRVPAFSGRIRIRYPIYTEREAEAPVIELEPDLSQQLERAFSERPRLP